MSTEAPNHRPAPAQDSKESCVHIICEGCLTDDSLRKKSSATRADCVALQSLAHPGLAQNMSKKESPPSFQEMVRERGPVDLQEARRYAASLPSHQQGIGGCYKVRCTCCPGCVAGYACPVQCGGCVWTPACFYMDLCIGLCFCNCADPTSPGAYTCTDLKGIQYDLVKVDGESGTLAYYSAKSTPSLYCEK